MNASLYSRIENNIFELVKGEEIILSEGVITPFIKQKETKEKEESMISRDTNN